MTRTLAASTALIALALALQSKTAPKPAAAPGSHSPTQRQPEPSKAPPVPAAPASQPAPQIVSAPTAPTTTHSSYFERLFSPENLPNILLFVGGISGIFVAVRTLKAIKRQADLMKNQADLMQDQVDLMKKQSELMVSKERPRLRVEMEPLNLTSDDPTDLLALSLKIIISGPTPAFPKRSSYSCWITGRYAGETMSGGSDSFRIPEVIEPNSPPYQSTIYLPIDKGAKAWLSDDQMKSLRCGKLSIHCEGEIVYSNVFDDTWAIPFSRQFINVEFLPDDFVGIWQTYGSNDKNEEYRVI